MTSSKQALHSLVVVLFATALGLGFAWLTGGNGAKAFGYPVFVICAATAFAVNWLAFIPAAIAQTEKYYDLVGAFTYFSIITSACILSAPLDTRAIVIAAMVVIWALRLGSFLFVRIGKSGGVDGRFDAIKVNPPRFLAAWTLQAVWTFITAAAALVVISATDRVPVGIWFWIGAVIWAAAFTVEVVADRQKSAFKSDPANSGKFISSGLWSWSQHPNYFGEIMLWTGAAIIALPVLSGWSYLVFASPLFITLLLTKISGINLLDKAAEKKWGDDPAYQEYRRKTSVLVLWPPRT
jgi:steroid 5-alpha reductase family enzyme